MCYVQDSFTCWSPNLVYFFNNPQLPKRQKSLNARVCKLQSTNNLLGIWLVFDSHGILLLFFFYGVSLNKFCLKPIQSGKDFSNKRWAFAWGSKVTSTTGRRYLSCSNMSIMSAGGGASGGFPQATPICFGFGARCPKRNSQTLDPSLEVPVMSELTSNYFCLKQTQAEARNSPEVKVEGHKQEQTFHFSHYWWQEKNLTKSAVEVHVWASTSQRTGSDSLRVPS